jgi:hypothetical protein
MPEKSAKSWGGQASTQAKKQATSGKSGGALKSSTSKTTASKTTKK